MHNAGMSCAHPMRILRIHVLYDLFYDNPRAHLSAEPTQCVCMCLYAVHVLSIVLYCVYVHDFIKRRLFPLLPAFAHEGARNRNARTP